jgi:hypothetical protein
MFKLYTDKANTFKCKVTVEGANESTALARLIIEGESHNLMFDGTLKEGICEVNIGKFKNFDNFKSKGFVKLEVIADDTYFTPWKSEYTVEQARTVVVEVIEEKKSSKPLVEVTEISYINNDKSIAVSDSDGEKIYSLLVKENIDFKKYNSLNKMLKYNVKAKQVIANFIVENNISGKKLDATLEYLVDKF